MKDVIKMIIAIFITGLLIVLIFCIIANIKNDEKTPKVETDNVDFGEIEYNTEDTELYSISTQRFSSSYSFIDIQVNKYIDALTLSVKNERLAEYRKGINDVAVLDQKINTYKVNDNILSVKVTAKIKKSGEENYSTIVKNFNFRLDLKRKLVLRELFDTNVTKKIGKENLDNFLLTPYELIIFNNSEEKSYSYNSLKKYSNSGLLIEENFKMTQNN